jgi:hypothetical protein
MSAYCSLDNIAASKANLAYGTNHATSQTLSIELLSEKILHTTDRRSSKICGNEMADHAVLSVNNMYRYHPTVGAVRRD